MISRLLRALPLLLLLVAASDSARADCTVAATGQTRPPGTIGYNVDYEVMQYCAGTTWKALIWNAGGGCAAPGDCPSVGSVCADGSIFAGYLADNDGSCRVVYVTDNNQSTGAQWKTSTGTDDISTDDHVDGQVNHTNRAGAIADFPAFDLCESNTYHGKSDWYLPAPDELNLLWLNRAAIDANAAGAFTASPYWSSTEEGTGTAWNQHFGYGYQYDNGGTKTNSLDVRCVRSVASTGDSGGPSACPNVGDTCPDGTVYAGQSPDGNVPMYVARCDIGMVWDGNNCTGSRAQPSWNNGNSTGMVTTGQTSTIDGDANTAALITIDSDGSTGGTQPHQAAQACADLSVNSHTDWYLPAYDELTVIYENLMDATPNDSSPDPIIDGFTTYPYWSSTEEGPNETKVINFANASFWQLAKNGTAAIRCARRGTPGGGGASCGVPDTGLVAHWKFDESSGATTAADSTGNGHTATLTNMTPASDWVPGKIGGALDFDGGDDVLIIPASPAFDKSVNGSATIAAWYRKQGTPGHSFLYGVSHAASTATYYGMEMHAAEVNYWDDIGGHIATTPVTMNAGEWNYIAITIENGTAVTMYFNGAQVGAGTAGDNLARTATEVRIGGSNYGDHLPVPAALIEAPSPAVCPP